MKDDLAVELVDWNFEQRGGSVNVALRDVERSGALVGIQGERWGSFIPGIERERKKLLVEVGGAIGIDQGQMRMV